MKAVRYPKINCCLITIGGHTIPDFILDAIEKEGLEFKIDTHITLIGYATGRIIDQFSQSDKKEIEMRCQRQDFSVTFTDHFSLLQEHVIEKTDNGNTIPAHTRKTIIQEAKVDQIQELYQLISSKVGQTIESPFLHITLASRSDYKPYMQRGIGLYSNQEYEQYLAKSLYDAKCAGT